VDGLQRALQPGSLPQLFQGEVIPFGQKGPEALTVDRQNRGCAPGPMMLRGDVPDAPALLEELLTMPKETRKR